MAKRSSPAADDIPNKRVACMECRQQKVKCDAHENSPCTRCRKKNLDCKLDVTFKRTAKRARMQQLEQEMERLRSQLDTDQQSSGGGALQHTQINPTSQQQQQAYIQSAPSPLSSQHQQQAHPVLPSMATRQQQQPSGIHHPYRFLHEGAAPSQPIPSHRQHQHPPAPPPFSQPDVKPCLSPASSSIRGLPATSYLPQRPHFDQILQTPDHLSLQNASTARTYDDVTLSPETISNLFVQFVQKYHPFLPVIDISKSPDEIYILCPALFWAIMAIASRRYDKDRQLMMHLTPVLRACMSDIYAISPVNKSGSLNVATVYSVQAFLLCTMWPPSTSMISTDSSWSSAGAAMFSAVRVGLHCPGYARDFARIKESSSTALPQIREQIRTWVCCNIVSQTIAGMYGFPSFTSFDATVSSFADVSDDYTSEPTAKNNNTNAPSATSISPTNAITSTSPYTSSPYSSTTSPYAAANTNNHTSSPTSSSASNPTASLTLRQMLQIARLEHEIEQTLNSSVRDPLGLSTLTERLSLIRVLSHKLDELELSLENASDFTRLVLLAARVHLLTYYFLDNDAMSSLQRERGLVESYNSALALLDHCDQASRKNRDFMRFLPQAYVQIIWQTTSIVNLVCHSRYAPYVDTSAGKTLYLNTIKHVGRASILKHDVCYRAAEIMQQIWQVYEMLAESKSNENVVNCKVAIRTRRAASVFFDSLWTMREECGIRSVAPAVVSQRLSDDEEDKFNSNNGSNNNQTIAATTNANVAILTQPTPSSVTSEHLPVAGPAHPVNVPTPTVEHDQFEWNMDLAWKDIDFMMTDFGFRVEEAGTYMA